MVLARNRKRWCLFLIVLCFVGLPAPAAPAQDKAPKVYVILWFDTEDYILPASDDAALRLAEFLTRRKVPATFKVVGEKARTLERRGRDDVIAALKKHEIGFHSNFHSVQPTPAVYLSNLGWDEGVAEFERRESPGLESVQRIFGVRPSCYGQPGSSWAPQSYGALRKWGVPVYLDGGLHVDLDGRPCYYCGILNLYKLDHFQRTKLSGSDELKKKYKTTVALHPPVVEVATAGRPERGGGAKAPGGPSEEERACPVHVRVSGVRPAPADAQHAARAALVLRHPHAPGRAGPARAC